MKPVLFCSLVLSVLFMNPALAETAGSAVAKRSPDAPPPAVNYAPELVFIPGGAFKMGSVEGNKDERPVREVTVRDFYMGSTEVTVGWYLRCMADSACEPPTWWSSGYFEDVPTHLTTAEHMRLPISGINWRQAKAFCRWLGPGYDLPSEAEWEYAAGAGKSWKYPWGHEGEDRRRVLGPQKLLMPSPSSPASPLGLYDLASGVWEWVEDCYEYRKNESGEKGKPCKTRVTKGGSWSEHTWNLRVANKSFGLESEGYKGLGFRVVYHAP